MKDSFRIVVGSLPDYEELVAEIYINEQFIGLISQEGGRDQTMIEIKMPDHVFKFPLAILEAALAEAKRRLSLLDQAR